jgi:hypothetical protein
MTQTILDLFLKKLQQLIINPSLLNKNLNLNNNSNLKLNNSKIPKIHSKSHKITQLNSKQRKNGRIQNLSRTQPVSSSNK